MNRLALILFSFLFTVNLAFSQDEVAKQILDDLAEKRKSYTDITAEFKWNFSNSEQEIDENSEVIIPECSWTGSVAPVIYQRAKPVFVDIDEETWCLDPDSVRESITEHTRAIISVDLYLSLIHI